MPEVDFLVILHNPLYDFFEGVKIMSTVLLDHEKLTMAMEESDLTQEELAEEFGITDRHLRYLKGKDTNVSASLLYRMSQIFRRPMESLLTVREDDAEK